MFFKQVWRNSARSRKGNGLLSGSLVIAIVAFYTLLSLGEQDVMRFLATIESDAVGKLLALLKLVYLVSLFFLFFLVYFACRYQTDSRRRELGLYQMLGMKRSRMFLLLFGETLMNSLISLLLGIPAALFLTEGISLATAKLVGLGIIGHRFAISAPAILGTVLGFVLVQLLSMLFICIQLGKTQPADFLRSDAAKSQTPMSGTKSMGYFVLGAVLLLTAYAIGIFLMKLLLLPLLALLVTAGILGTFFLYRGLGGFLGLRIRKKSPQAVGLDTFTARQVQEQVLAQYKPLAVASLLLVLALSCISYGISVGFGRTAGGRTADFSLFGEEAEIARILGQAEIGKMVKESYPLQLSLIKDPYMAGGKEELDKTNLKEILKGIEGSGNLVENLHLEYVISESSYNHVLRSMGKEDLHLGEKEVALYTSMHRDSTEFYEILQEALERGPSVGIQGSDYTILPELCYDNVVADRAISLYLALIVPDELFGRLARETSPYCWNLHLTEEAVEELGLMQAVQKMDEQLAAAGITYDSYLSGIGRNLFYTVAASYLTIYLGLLFLLIANTVIGLKFLIQQRQTRGRYVTLSMLGARAEAMAASVKKQIRVYFLLVLGVSSLSSAAAIVSLFTSVTRLPAGTSLPVVGGLAALALAGFLVIELIYIGVVRRTAVRETGRVEGEFL